MYSNMTNASSADQQWLAYLGLCCGIVLQLLSLFGIIGNGLSAYIFLQRTFRSVSLNILLAALSLADLLLLLFGIPVFTSGPLLAYFESNFLYFVNIYSTAYLYPIAIMFQCISIWLLMLITFERWLAVCRPFLVAAYCTRTRALCGIAIVIVSSLCYNFPKFFDFSIDDTYVLVYNKRYNLSYILWYSTISWIALSYILPLVVLISLNTCVVREIVRANHKRQQMSKREKEKQSTVTMLLYVILVFLFCYTLSFILQLMEIFQPDIFPTDLGFILTDLNNLLGLLNSATGVIFYLRFSTRFRSTLLELCGRNRQQKDSYYSFAHTTQKQTKQILSDGYIRGRANDMEGGRRNAGKNAERWSIQDTIELADFMKPVNTVVKAQTIVNRKRSSEPNIIVSV